MSTTHFSLIPDKQMSGRVSRRLPRAVWLVWLWMAVCGAWSMSGWADETASREEAGEAVAQGVDRLLKMRNRPTVSDVVRELSPWPTRNPFKERVKAERGQLTISQAAKRMGPRVIAEFEAAFPGATFAPLGRDVVFIGDLLDAFYQSLGQEERIQRIDASYDTIHTDPSLLAEYLKQIGFDPEAPGQHPFIFFDYTSYQHESQSYLLMEAAYEAYRANGGDGSELFYYFNGLSTKGSSDIDEDVEMALDEIAKDSDGGPPVQLLNVSDAKLSYAAIAGSELHWHGSFGELRPRKGGEGLVAKPGRLSHKKVRETILHHMFNIVELAADPKFHGRVFSQAEKLEYKFPRTRLQSRELPNLDFDINKAHKEYEALIKRLGAVQKNGKFYFGTCARKSVQWYKSHLARATKADVGEDLVMLFLEGVFEARGQSKITARDMRRMIAFALAQLGELGGQPSESFLTWFRSVFQNEPILAAIWTERSSYFLDRDPGRRGGLAVPDMYEKINKALDQEDQPESGATGESCSGSFSVPKNRRKLLGGS